MFVVWEATETPIVFTQKQGRYLLGKLNLNVSWYPSLLFFPRSSGAVMPYRWGAETLEWSRCWWWWSWSYVMSDDHGGDAGREEARPKMLTFSSWWQWWGITAALRSLWCWLPTNPALAWPNARLYWEIVKILRKSWIFLQMLDKMRLKITSTRKLMKWGKIWK